MRTVLIVEDHAEIRELIRITLEFDDYRIVEAGTGVAGLRAAELHRPALILTDVMMPDGMDGVALCRRVRAHPDLHDTKLIILSAKTQDADRAAGLEAGADAYLTKPFSPLELLDVIQRVLR